MKDGELWAGLVLRFDYDLRITEIKTAEPAELDPGEPLVDAPIGWTEDRHGGCVLAIVLDRADAAALLKRRDKTVGLRELQDAGRLTGARLTEPLAAALR